MPLSVHRAVWILVNVCYPVIYVWTDVPGSGGRPGHLCKVSSTPRAQRGRRGSGPWRRGVDVPGVLVPELCSLPRTFPLSIPAKEHNVHWLLSCLVSPTPLLPGAARHFLTRTRSIQGAKPWGQSGREPGPTATVSATGEPPRSGSGSQHLSAFAMPRSRADHFTWTYSPKPSYSLSC